MHWILLIHVQRFVKQRWRQNTKGKCCLVTTEEGIHTLGHREYHQAVCMTWKPVLVCAFLKPVNICLNFPLFLLFLIQTWMWIQCAHLMLLMFKPLGLLLFTMRPALLLIFTITIDSSLFIPRALGGISHSNVSNCSGKCHNNHPSFPDIVYKSCKIPTCATFTTGLDNNFPKQRGGQVHDILLLHLHWTCSI